jgi:hypothetical protein
MRTKLLAVLISIAGCVAVAGCSTEADYREDVNPPPQDSAAPSSAGGAYTDPAGTDRSAEAGAAASDAASVGAYEEWDTDASGDVSKTEFDSKFASLPAWSEWDANGDQSLDESEAKNVQWFEGGSFTEMDPDGDGKLARDEAGDALWKAWDANGDNKIEPSEWPLATA